MWFQSQYIDLGVVLLCFYVVLNEVIAFLFIGIAFNFLSFSPFFAGLIFRLAPFFSDHFFFNIFARGCSFKCFLKADVINKLNGIKNQGNMFDKL